MSDTGEGVKNGRETEKKKPSPAGKSGRDTAGRFVKGNTAGIGNPLGPRIQRLRSELVDAVTPADVRAIAAKLVEKARKGDLAATRTLFLYTLGRPIEPDVLERIEGLEKMAEFIRRS